MGKTHAAGEEGANTALGEAMSRVGDRWSLLVIDALLQGSRRFSDLQASIPGLAPNVLAARLRRLEREGLVAATRYSDRPPRFEYRTSDAGRQLAGALRLLTHWGAAFAVRGGDEIDGPRHRACGSLLEARWYCPTCQSQAEPGDDQVVWL